MSRGAGLLSKYLSAYPYLLLIYIFSFFLSISLEFVEYVFSILKTEYTEDLRYIVFLLYIVDGIYRSGFDLLYPTIFGWFIVVILVATLLWLFLTAEAEKSRGVPNISGIGAVAWFFIPIANLVMPYRIMCRIWKSRMGDASIRALQLWWSFHIFAIAAIVLATCIIEYHDLAVGVVRDNVRIFAHSGIPIAEVSEFLLTCFFFSAVMKLSRSDTGKADLKTS